MIKKNYEKPAVSVSKIIETSFLFLAISFVLSFLIMHQTLNDLWAGMQLPWPQSLWILPCVFLIEAVPSWILSYRLTNVAKENDETDQQLSTSFTIPQMALMYFFSTTAEELLFRHTIQNWLTEYTTPFLAIILTSSLWFWVHKRFRGSWQLYLLLLWIGGVYGFVYAATGSWLLVSISHFLHNFVLGAAGKIIDRYKKGSL